MAWNRPSVGVVAACLVLGAVTAVADARLVRPGSQKGEVVIANCQSAADGAWIASMADYFRNETLFRVAVKDGCAFDLKQAVPAGEARLYVIDDGNQPPSLAAPESRWAMVNVAELKSADRGDDVPVRVHSRQGDAADERLSAGDLGQGPHAAEGADEDRVRSGEGTVRGLRRTSCGRAAALFVLAALPFLRCWDYGLVNLDDYSYLIGHPQLWQGPFLSSVAHFLTTLREAIWMPLTWASYALDYAAFDDWYGGFHLHSLAVHAVNAALVGSLLRKLFVRGEEGRRFAELACIAGAVLWAVHPLRCESVVLLSSRKDVLSFFWELLALHCWVDGSAGDPAQEARRTYRAMVFFALGALCKPSVMTFPALCLLIDFFVCRRVDVRRYIEPLAFALILSVFASWQQRAGGALQDFAGETVLMRLADCAAAFGVYVRNTVWPTRLAVQCVKRWPELPHFLVPSVFLSLAYAVCLVVRLVPFVRRAEVRFPSGGRDFLRAEVLNRAEGGGVLFGLLWFGVAIAPMLGFVPFGVHAFADRFTYIPSVGLSVALVAALLRLSDTVRPALLLVPCGVLAAALGAMTWRQTGYWRDDGTAFAHTLEVDGGRNPFAHKALSGWHFDVTHDLDACIWHYERVLEFGKQCVDSSYIIYMLALCERGDSKEAARQMAKIRAIRRPNNYLSLRYLRSK